jgi:hypothetical protein
MPVSALDSDLTLAFNRIKESYQKASLEESVFSQKIDLFKKTAKN